MTKEMQDFSIFGGESKYIRFITTGIEDIENITECKWEATYMGDREVNEIEKDISSIEISDAGNDTTYIDVKLDSEDTIGLDKRELLHELTVYEDDGVGEYAVVTARGTMRVKESIIL